MEGNNCDVCGWFAAIGGMLAFGSFGVPIKQDVPKSLDIDPLVFQTYKTTMCFLTSWLVLAYGEEFIFTPWGIVSGLFWVPAGIATIFAVKNAGLALAIGVSSSFIVLVSFYWGIFVFGEHVHSRVDACFAVGCMMVGLLGMAYHSAPSDSNSDGGNHTSQILDHRDSSADSDGSDYQQLGNDEPLEDGVDDDDDEDPTTESTQIRQDEDDFDDEMVIVDDTSIHHPNDYVTICGVKWKRRTLGILSAMFTGTYGGSIMAPMKFAPPEAEGLEFLISFAIGAVLVNLTLWIIRFLYLYRRHGTCSRAYQALPCFHLRKMWFYGGICGTVWSIGNFFSILSVEFLGEGVGYSVVQASMLVSGLWGIFYFHEVQGAVTITKWFLSAGVTVLGILLLSYEHHEK